MAKKSKKTSNYIVLYKDDFKTNQIWIDYCELLGVEDTCTEIKINIKSIEKLK